MTYLMRGSMREGEVAPGLWGPYSTTDFPGWSGKHFLAPVSFQTPLISLLLSDQMTLDYNFQVHGICMRH
jgi:hypothetical protein